MEETVKINYEKLIDKKDKLIALKGKLEAVMIVEDIMAGSEGDSSRSISEKLKKLQLVKSNIDVSLDRTIYLIELIQSEFGLLEEGFVHSFE